MDLCDDELIELADRYGYLKRRLDSVQRELDRVEELLLSSKKRVIQGDTFCVITVKH